MGRTIYVPISDRVSIQSIGAQLSLLNNLTRYDYPCYVLGCVVISCFDVSLRGDV